MTHSADKKGGNRIFAAVYTEVCYADEAAVTQTPERIMSRIFVAFSK